MKNMYPAFIAGIFLCAILAASMSTADSQLLAASSAVSQDIFKGLIKKNAEEKEVIDSYEGEKSYTEVVNNPKEYLFQPQLALT